MDKHTYLQEQHTRCNPDMEVLSERKAEAIHIPDMTDNPLLVEDNLQKMHNLEQAAGNPEADILDTVDMADMQAEKEAHQRDARPESLTRVRDRAFGDLHAYVAHHR